LFGNTHGTTVHAAVVVAEVTAENRKYGQRIGKVYDSLCTQTNTHNVNKGVRLALLPEGTEITCEKCLRRMQERETPEWQEKQAKFEAYLAELKTKREQEQGLQKFSEQLHADLFGAQQ
jgi:rubrerythrin